MIRKITLKTPNSKRPLFTDEKILNNPFALRRELEEKRFHQAALEKRIKEAPHMSKPNAPNATVVRDKDGHWLFEYYMPEE